MFCVNCRKKYLILIPILVLAVGIIAISGTDFLRGRFIPLKNIFSIP